MINDFLSQENSDVDADVKLTQAVDLDSPTSAPDKPARSNGFRFLLGQSKSAVCLELQLEDLQAEKAEAKSIDTVTPRSFSAFRALPFLDKG